MNFKNIFNSKKTGKVHPSIFMFLFLPFGVLYGYVSVTIGFLLTKADIPLALVAPVISVALLPNIFKFIWAPLVDTTLTVKRWYLIANVITAIGIFITGILPLKVEYLTLMTIVVLVTNFGNTFVFAIQSCIWARCWMLLASARI